jgi:hypothetical protein
MSANGTKRTSQQYFVMSAFDPKRTSPPCDDDKLSIRNALRSGTRAHQCADSSLIRISVGRDPELARTCMRVYARTRGREPEQARPISISFTDRTMRRASASDQGLQPTDHGLPLRESDPDHTLYMVYGPVLPGRNGDSDHAGEPGDGRRNGTGCGHGRLHCAA